MKSKVSKFTQEQDDEITTLLLEGCTNQDVVDLVAEKYKMLPHHIVNKIGYIKRLYKISGNKIPHVYKTKPVKLIPKAIVEKKKEEKKIEEPEDVRIKRLSKIKITGIKRTVPTVNFPLVARYIKNTNNHVVLFTSLHRGVVLHPGDSPLYAGYVNENFASCVDPNSWEILDEITLTFYS